MSIFQKPPDYWSLSVAMTTVYKGVEHVNIDHPPQCEVFVSEVQLVVPIHQMTYTFLEILGHIGSLWLEGNSVVSKLHKYYIRYKRVEAMFKMLCYMIGEEINIIKIRRLTFGLFLGLHINLWKVVLAKETHIKTPK